MRKNYKLFQNKLSSATNKFLLRKQVTLQMK